ncbi:YczE/YyaS/YitT family protein [Streptomyces chilikensis]|uniref:membrane protein YczE n=1 Tax=Streptomyces chilikensis TaxID=1194079 RepID=UPI003F4D1C8F
MPVRRLVQLYVGLTLYGASCALLLRAELGLEPWGVLNQGVSELTGLTVGTVSVLVGALVLLLWIPLRQRPGLGTVSNVFVVGLTMDATLALVPPADGLPARWLLLLAGLVLNGIASGLYISAGFGPGPRDGLMTGLHRRTGRSLRLMRTAVELSVVATGFLLGGTVGAGTLLYALAIGPLVQFFLRLFAPAPAPDPDAAPDPAPAAAPTEALVADVSPADASTAGASTADSPSPTGPDTTRGPAPAVRTADPAPSAGQARAPEGPLPARAPRDAILRP